MVFYVSHRKVIGHINCMIKKLDDRKFSWYSIERKNDWVNDLLNDS